MQNKMQHVLKREPCHKCQLPVFLAERLVHGARLYHRTCMRCARCKSQLTPGNFYETEQDDEFCCETCPDEDHRDADVETESRKSFSNKLALFQTKAVEESGKGLLAKSLSDEEKSKSLKRLTAMYSMQSEASVDYKSGAGMSTFMSAQLGQEQTNTNGDDHAIVESEDDEDDDDDESDEEDEPPQLPVAKPPIATYKPSIATKPTTIAISTATTTTTNSSNVTPVTESKTLVQPAPTHTEKLAEPPVVGTAAPTENLGLNIPDDAKETNLADSDTKDLSEASTVTRLIGVRDRLHMFETNSDNKSDEPNSRTSCKKLFDDPVPDDPDIHDPVVPVAETIEIPDVIEPEENASSNKETLALEHFQELALRQAIEEINDKVHEHEEERKSQTPEPLPPRTPSPPREPLPSRTPSPPPVVPTPRKRTPKLIANVVEPSQPTEKPEIKIRTTTDLAANEVQPKPVLEPKESYPIEYNPFDDNDDEAVDEPVVEHNAAKRHSLNPFDSSDDEVELDKVVEPKVTVHVVEPTTTVSHSLNPFGSESEDEDDPADSKRTPVPTPRKITPDLSSLHSTPEPTPRSSRAVSMTPQNLNRTIGYLETPSPLNRSHNHFGSTTSLASTTSTLSAYTRRHKSRAPLPPPSASKLDVVTASTSNSPCPSNRSSPCTSNRNTPTLSRKKRIAPPPPSAAKPIAEIDEKAFDQSRLTTETTSSRPATPPPDYKETPAPNVVRKLIPIDVSLIEENESAEHLPSLPPAPTEVVYRRTIMPLDIAHSPAVISNDTHDRQWQKVKENKESLNKNRQSQGSMSPEGPDFKSPPANETSIYSNKSTHGKWKRRKGPAPSLPSIMGGASSGHQRGALQMLPLQDIRYELEVIEVQQQGLEKQGIQLEKMIRERCEGGDVVKPIEELANTPNTKEVEDLILQLFEIVNEKNELFRRQAELMYLRRLHRLEQEQAQIEFDIRMLMAQPENNKTDSDKAREDALIARKVEIVLQRNEVIECLDADRLREAEEDQSIKLRLELHNARRVEEDEDPATPTKLSKKEKKKLRETKKLAKQKKMDADKDADESEMKAVADAATKKKKRKFLF